MQDFASSFLRTCTAFWRYTTPRQQPYLVVNFHPHILCHQKTSLFLIPINTLLPWTRSQFFSTYHRRDFKDEIGPTSSACALASNNKAAQEQLLWAKALIFLWRKTLSEGMGGGAYNAGRLLFWTQSHGGLEDDCPFQVGDFKVPS